MTPKALYYRDGKRITEDEALDPNGAIRDHVVMRVPKYMRDGMSSLQSAVADDLVRRSLVTDGHGDTTWGLHKPGFRIRVDDTRQQVADAYAEYNVWIQNAWRAR